MDLIHQVNISDQNDAYLNSRTSLQKLLLTQGFRVNDLKVDLELINFQNLPKFPDYLVSLSHTKGAGAAVIALKNEYLSLGIDIEWNERIMKPGTEKFYRHPEDSLYENNLELWTMKEAAFKALSPLGYPGVLVLSKIIIQDGIFWTNEKKEIKGKVDSLKFLSNERLLQIAIASVQK